MYVEESGLNLSYGTVPSFSGGTEKGHENYHLVVYSMFPGRDSYRGLPEYEAGTVTIQERCSI
jgi:hypothetical protein